MEVTNQKQEPIKENIYHHQAGSIAKGIDFVYSKSYELELLVNVLKKYNKKHEPCQRIPENLKEGFNLPEYGSIAESLLRLILKLEEK